MPHKDTLRKLQVLAIYQTPTLHCSAYQRVQTVFTNSNSSSSRPVVKKTELTLLHWLEKFQKQRADCEVQLQSVDQAVWRDLNDDSRENPGCYWSGEVGEAVV